MCVFHTAHACRYTVYSVVGKHATKYMISLLKKQFEYQISYSFQAHIQYTVYVVGKHVLKTICFSIVARLSNNALYSHDFLCSFTVNDLVEDIWCNSAVFTAMIVNKLTSAMMHDCV